jgi:hypothetical protein
VLKPEDKIAECQAKFKNDIENSRVGQACKDYLDNPGTRGDLEDQVLKEWCGKEPNCPKPAVVDY